MHEKNLKIDKLIIGNLYDNGGALKLIQERDNDGLTCLEIEHSMSDSERKQLLNKLKCKSITTLELTHYNIKSVNAMLEWKMIAQKQILVIIDVYVYDCKYNNNDEILNSFQTVYQNVYQSFVQQIALDIKIEFREVRDSKLFESYLSLYSSYFENSELLLKYNKPKCNSNLCLPCVKPHTYFRIHDSKKDSSRYFVFGASNVQIK